MGLVKDKIALATGVGAGNGRATALKFASEGSMSVMKPSGISGPGLKTPLTVMLAIAQDLRKDRLDEHADEIETQVESMRHYIERELARVRSKTLTASTLMSHL